MPSLFVSRCQICFSFVVDEATIHDLVFKFFKESQSKFFLMCETERKLVRRIVQFEPTVESQNISCNRSTTANSARCWSIQQARRGDALTALSRTPHLFSLSLRMNVIWGLNMPFGDASVCRLLRLPEVRAVSSAVARRLPIECKEKSR